MTSLAEFFEREAHAGLEQLRALTATAAPEPALVHRAARALRGSAQMAREERVYRAALALETAVKPVAAARPDVWDEPLIGCVRQAVDDLAVLIDGAQPSPELDGRLRAALERWHAVGVELPDAVLGRAAQHDVVGGTREFRVYAARELEGIAEVLEQGVRALRADPMDREPLKAILRRQRALRGAARLEEIPVVAEILHAVEDLTRVIAKLDVGVKQEWIDIYRVAREGLASAVPALQDDRDPAASSALARLRHLRTELLARYGTGERVNPSAGPGEGLAPVQRSVPLPPPPPSLPPAEPAAVPIATLEYRGEAALRRALSLRQRLEETIPDDPDMREQLEELFDLIRLALE